MHSNKLKNLHQGESLLRQAPVVKLANGENCTPQHFFSFEHSIDSVEALLASITFNEAYPVFVSKDQASLFIQVGVVGQDNYGGVNSNYGPDKIVYGRKWRVGKNLPTSEIIQTVFLAIKKSREHELRELLTLRDNDTGKVSTPFNGHHDLPLMANNSELFDEDSLAFNELLTQVSIQQFFNAIKVGGREIHLQNIHKRPNNCLIDLYITPSKQTLGVCGFQELNGLHLSLLLNHESLNELVHELMSELIKISDRYVEEHFLFNGFSRFSRKKNVVSIGRFSIHTRNINDKNYNDDHKQVFKEHNGVIDESRVPIIYNNAQKIRLGKLLNK